MSIRSRAGLAALLIAAAVIARADGISWHNSGGQSDGFQAASWVLPGFAVDCNFAAQRYWGPCALTVSRASQATTLLPTSASGAAFATAGNNVARIVTGLGLLVEESRTNFLLNSTAPATQTTGNLANGTYTLWVNGPGTATMSAGTATGCGTAAASQGAPISFTTSGAAGNCTVTVAGSLNAFQLELNPGSVSAPTSLILTAAATATRSADVIALTSPPTFGAAYTLFGVGTPYFPNAFATDQCLLMADDGTANNRTSIRKSNTSGAALFNTVAGGVSTTLTAATFTAATSGKLVGSIASGADAASFNAGAPLTGAPSLPATPTNVRVGSIQSGVAQFNGYIARIAIAPNSAILSAQLQAITNLNGYN